MLPDLHPKIRSRLDDYQLELIGEVAAIDESALCAVFGSTGRTLRARARGIDPSPVLPPERRAEFHIAHTLATDTNDLGVLHPLLRVLGERLGRRLRQSGLVARRLRVEATYNDYTVVARSVALHAAALDAELWDGARRGFTQANTRRLAVRAVSLTLDRLEIRESQLGLWDVFHQPNAAMQSEGGAGLTERSARSAPSARHGPHPHPLRRSRPLARLHSCSHQVTTTLPKLSLFSISR